MQSRFESNDPESQAQFKFLVQILTSRSMRVVEDKESDEKAITVRVQPDIADRLDSYAKAARMSRSLLIRMLLEGALDEMDDLVLAEKERREREEELMSFSTQEAEETKRKKLNQVKAVLDTWK